MSLRIIKPGISTTLQDIGRRGFQSAGVPVSGAMDTDSMQLANLLCGNDPNEVVLETSLHGAEWLVEEEQLIAFCGSGATLLINNKPAPFNRSIRVKASTLLSLKPAASGCRSYMAAAGGFKARTDLKSKSTYKTAAIGGQEGRALKAGDLLEWGLERKELCRKIVDSLPLNGSDLAIANWGAVYHKNPDQRGNIIRVFRGPEWDWFDEQVKEKLFNNSFGVTNQSDRMGYRLSGIPMMLSKKQEMISTAVCMGTIQVTHEGSLVILMADAQTTGGYPRLAMVAAVDLPVCAQMRPGNRFYFKEISINHAEALLTEKEKTLKQIEKSIFMKFTQ